MKKINISLLLALVVASIFMACSQKDDDTLLTDENPNTDNSASDPGTLTIQFKHLFGSNDFTLGNEFTIESGQSINANKLKYYLSNFKLLTDGGTDYVEANSYHLINVEGKLAVELTGIPVGTYTSLEFSIGVDKDKNHEIDSSGDLDPNGNMAWSWAVGYKFLSVEGTYNSSGKTGSMIHHIGDDELYRTINLDFTDASLTDFEVTSGSTKKLNVDVDISEVYKTPNTIDIEAASVIMSLGANATAIANNYVDMFTLKSFE